MLDGWWNGDLGGGYRSNLLAPARVATIVQLVSPLRNVKKISLAGDGILSTTTLKFELLSWHRLALYSGARQENARSYFTTAAAMQNPAESIIRCLYCRVGNEFRQMAMRIEGWLHCGNCGHNAMPVDAEFRCTRPKCHAHQSRTSSTDVAELD